MPFICPLLLLTPTVRSGFLSFPSGRGFSDLSPELLHPLTASGVTIFCGDKTIQEMIKGV